MALTSAEAVDSANVFPNVGSIMVWRDPNNPLGLPGGLAGQVTAVLIHSQTILTAGHFAARAEVGNSRHGFGSSSASLRMHSTSPRGSISTAPWARASLIRRFRGPALRRVARSTTSTGNMSLESVTWVCVSRRARAWHSPAKLANRSLDDEVSTARDESWATGRRRRLRAVRRTRRSTMGSAMGNVYRGPGRRSELGHVQPRPVAVCFGDSGAPTFFDGRVVAIASDGAAIARPRTSGRA